MLLVTVMAACVQVVTSPLKPFMDSEIFAHNHMVGEAGRDLQRLSRPTLPMRSAFVTF